VTKRILLVGGIDPSGGAGLTLDAAVLALHGAEPLPVVVALTEQNRRGFRRWDPLPAERWRGALAAVADDGPFAAVKLGLLGDPATVAALADWLAARAPAVPIVVDPVLGATTGGFAPGPVLAAAYRRWLVPLATVLTPNLPELAALGGAVAPLLAAGARAVLVKGGHGDGAFADDVLWRVDGAQTFRRPRLRLGAVRGTGCALASALASRLAAGADLATACRGAGDWLARLLAALGDAGPGDALPRQLPLAMAPRGV
jgi:hydroxymethylpyrimidine/phosphomethylpyrimidine kinase